MISAHFRRKRPDTVIQTILLALAVVAVWGTNFVVIKLALPLLLRLAPRSPNVTVRVAKALAAYPDPAVDRRLLEWLADHASKVREAGALLICETDVDIASAGEGEVSLDCAQTIMRGAPSCTSWGPTRSRWWQ